MIFRTSEGKLMEINIYDFVNDKVYYEKIMEIKKKSSKIEKTFKDKNNK